MKGVMPPWGGPSLSVTKGNGNRGITDVRWVEMDGT